MANDLSKAFDTFNTHLLQAVSSTTFDHSTVNRLAACVVERLGILLPYLPITTQLQTDCAYDTNRQIVESSVYLKEAPRV